MFDEIETETGTCFPIHFVVSVSLYDSSLQRQDSKLKTANGHVFKHFSILSAWNIEKIQHFKQCFFQLVNILWANVFNSLATANQM